MLELIALERIRFCWVLPLSYLPVHVMTVYEQWSQWGQWFVHASAIGQTLFFFGIWVGIWLPIAVPLAIALQWRPTKPLTLAQKLTFVLSLYLVAPLLLWGIATLQNVPFAVYGITWNGAFLRSLAIGLGAGSLGIAALVGLEAWWGWIDWQPQQWQQIYPIALPTLLLGLVISLIEELVFRGFLLNQLQQESPFWVAATASSLVFALLHLVWEGRKVAPQLPGLWLMGMVLVLARWADLGSLGIACGLHAGWIWGMASLDGAQMFRYSRHVPAWVTGIGDSPLAGAMGITMLGITGLAVWGLAIG